MNPWLIGMIAVSTIGVISGIIGTCRNIQNTTDLREKAFVVKASIISWIVAVIFLILFFICSEQNLRQVTMHLHP
jgi:hypothetical protein